MNQVAQGDLLFIRRESKDMEFRMVNLPLQGRRVAGRIIIERGEGDHVHVLDAPAGGLVVVGNKNNLPDWIVVEEPAEVKHLDLAGKPSKYHVPVMLEEGVWEVRRQTDYQPEAPPVPRNWE